MQHVHREHRERRNAAIHALVIVSAPSDPSKPTRTVFSSIRRGAEQLWFFVESVPSADPREAAMRAIWRVLGEALARRLTKLDVHVSEPEVISIVERKQPAPEELGRWYIQVRARCNQIGQVRFVGVEKPARGSTPRRRSRKKRELEPTLFDSAVA